MVDTGLHGRIVMMRYLLQFKPYRRNFLKPIRLGQYPSTYREGILLKLSDESGVSGYGEVAPIESFGSESVERAIALLKSFCGMIRDESILGMNASEYPCLRYALHSAREELSLRLQGSDHSTVDEYALIPSAKLIQPADLSSDLQDSDIPLTQKVLKLKVGGSVIGEKDELAHVIELADACRKQSVRIRLDANENWDSDKSKRWIDALAPFSDVIEFIEQPMDRWFMEELVQFANESPIPIALDESMQVLHSGSYQVDDLAPFLFVVKPSLGDADVVGTLGVPKERIIISSVFETGIGFSKILSKGPFLNVPGLDTQSVFSDDLSYPKESGGYRFGRIDSERLWQRIT